ncbi:Ferrochelatase [Kingella potus]|uniref:Ferrochelatase n=1 Tax=Kingella potus TaxID=265175 RepID=A0A377R2P6_9NEIS|nr:ferrochelatase [Kingella potus]STR02529.1 Ferrochelatase [Kingella potus]
MKPVKRYQAEPALPAAAVRKTGILLINLGTPAAPTAEAVRPYLRQFLSDPRVIELPKLLWQPVLRGIVLPLRGKKSAANYKKIWLKEGSPLMVYSQRQAKALAARLPDTALVRCAMTYGLPDIAYTLAELAAQGADKILVLPLFPQYAASSSGAALDAVWRAMLHRRNQPAVRTVRSFHNHPGYIEALRRQISAYWQQHGKGKHLLMSFHSIPRAHADAGDPYPQECRETARLLAAALGLKENEYTAAFQSRFGGGKWLEPAVSPLLSALPKQGIEELDVVCPAFVSDCLETMEEIAVEGRETFHAAGGKTFRYIPCLNDNPDWIDTLAAIVRHEAAGWL